MVFRITLLILLLDINFNLSAQYYSKEQVKSAFIYQFSNNLEWPQKDEYFDIGVFALDTTIVEELKNLAKTKKINNQEIRIHSDNIDNLINTCEIIYISNYYSQNIDHYYLMVMSKPIILISDESDNQLYIMINFIEKDNKISFEINRKNIEDQNIIIKPQLLLLGGNELDIRYLYVQTEKELQLQKDLVLEQQ